MGGSVDAVMGAAIDPYRKSPSKGGRMRRMLRGIFLIPVVLALTTGCATRDWVRDLVGKKQVEFDQRLDEHAQRVESRFKTVETGLGETGGIARGARERAETAQGRADDVDNRLACGPIGTGGIWSKPWRCGSVSTGGT
jgi:hypothetical protein